VFSLYARHDMYEELHLGWYYVDDFNRMVDIWSDTRAQLANGDAKLGDWGYVDFRIVEKW